MEDKHQKDKILKGAEELFTRYGVRSVTMDDIARHLGISKKTIYQFFLDKDDIIMSSSLATLKRDRDDLDQKFRESKTPVERMVKLSTSLRDRIKNVNPSMLFDLQKYHPAVWALWQEFKSGYVRDALVRTIIEGIDQGYFRAEINPFVLATARMEMVQIGFDPKIFDHGQFTLTEIQNQLLDNFVQGLLTDKGRKVWARHIQEIADTQQSQISTLHRK